MKVPKIVKKNKREYKFVKQVNNNLFLYEETRLGFKETFSRADLKIIDNTEIDKIIQENPETKIKLVVYDRLTEKEAIYNTFKDVQNFLEIGYVKLKKAVDEHKWIKQRWFCERREYIQ